MDPRHGDKTFPVLGDPPFPREQLEKAVAELRAAGLPRGCETVSYRECEVLVKGTPAERAASRGIYITSEVAKAPKEWVPLYKINAEAYGWKFWRNWYYWVCHTEGEALPLDIASKLFAEYGQEVRTDGSCACPAPSRDVDCYHVDTPAGLAALVEALNENHARIRAVHEAEMERKYGRP